MVAIIFKDWLLLFVIVVLTDTSSAQEDNANKVNEEDAEEYPTKTGSQCFHVKGVPTLKLRCPGGELINVQSSFFGAPPKNSTCEFSRAENHCIQLTDLQENCMGRYMCSVYVSNPFLMNCRTYANYMQVNYTCIPKTKIYDFCQGVNLESAHGFLRTPNYPDSNYTANTHCACRLKTKGRSIKFKIHDFSVNHTKVGECDSDYLKISGWGKKCGHLSPERLPETLEINRQDILIEFKTDAEYQSRGLWMEFSASKETSLTCGPVKHQDSKNTDKTKSTDGSPTQNESGGKGGTSLVLLDSNGKDSAPFWMSEPGTVAREEPGTPFGNWVPHDHGQHNAFDKNRDSAWKPTNSDKSGNEAAGILSPDGGEEIDVGDGDDADGDTFDNYDFNETQEVFSNKIDSVQMITGIVVGLLILIAVIIIIVLVFRR